VKLLLVHNPAAGPDDREDAELIEAFRRAGHDVSHVELDGDTWQHTLDRPLDAVVAAGGDGSIRAVVLALAARRHPPPLTILPAGTANNISRCFAESADFEAAVERLGARRIRKLTVGSASGPWGEERFVEAAGVGVFAQMLREDYLQPDREKPRYQQLKEGSAHLLDVLRREPPRQLQVEIDGRDLSGQYWLAEVMNIPSIGARLDLAPRAEPGDGLLDLVLIGWSERPRFEEYLECRARGVPAMMPDLAVRGRRIVLGWPDEDGHIDDMPWPDGPHPDAVVTLDIRASIDILV
jgi:diacylglycerol kinase family enzyme